MRILDQLPPAAEGPDMLPMLLVAAGVVKGPKGIQELAEHAAGWSERGRRRLAGVVEEGGAPGPLGRTVSAALANARAAEPTFSDIKIRAVNEAGGRVREGFVLRTFDLMRLAWALRPALEVAEMAERPGPAGLRRGAALAQHPPDVELVDKWRGRLLPGPLRGARPLWPRGEDHVLLVFDDGRLAYDPVEPPPED